MAAAAPASGAAVEEKRAPILLNAHLTTFRDYYRGHEGRSDALLANTVVVHKAGAAREARQYFQVKTSSQKKAVQLDVHHFFKVDLNSVKIKEDGVSFKTKPDGFPFDNLDELIYHTVAILRDKINGYMYWAHLEVPSCTRLAELVAGTDTADLLDDPANYVLVDFKTPIWRAVLAHLARDRLKIIAADFASQNPTFPGGTSGRQRKSSASGTDLSKASQLLNIQEKRLLAAFWTEKTIRAVDALIYSANTRQLAGLDTRAVLFCIGQDTRTQPPPRRPSPPPSLPSSSVAIVDKKEETTKSGGKRSKKGSPPDDNGPIQKEIRQLYEEGRVVIHLVGGAETGKESAIAKLFPGILEEEGTTTRYTQFSTMPHVAG